MVNKYLKYILFSFILIISLSMKVDALTDTVCVYNYKTSTADFKISYIISSNGNLTGSYTVKDLKNNKSKIASFGSAVQFESGIVNYVSFSQDAITAIKNQKYCVNLGTLLDGSQLFITTKNKVALEGQVYSDLNANSTQSTGGTIETLNPIDPSTLFTKVINGITFTFAKTKNGDYYLKVSNGTNEADNPYKKGERITINLDTNGIQYTYMFYESEIDTIWNNGKNMTIYMFDRSATMKVLTIQSNIDDIDTARPNYSKTNPITEVTFFSNMCNDDGYVVRVIRVIGYILVIVKILVPVGLIVFGIINFSKVMLTGDDDAIKKNTISFVWKIVAAVVIFVLPTIINFIVGMIDGSTDGTADYENCRVCIFDPKNCVIPEK